MNIKDTRIKQEANIGDIIATNKNNKYILLINNLSNNFPLAICDIEKDIVISTTQQKVFCLGGTILNETIVEIIPKLKLNIIID